MGGVFVWGTANARRRNTEILRVAQNDLGEGVSRHCWWGWFVSFTIEVYGYGWDSVCPGDSGRWKWDSVLAAQPSRSGQAGAGAGWRRHDDSADVDAVVAGGRCERCLGGHQPLAGQDDRRADA